MPWYNPVSWFSSTAVTETQARSNYQERTVSTSYVDQQGRTQIVSFTSDRDYGSSGPAMGHPQREGWERYQAALALHNQQEAAARGDTSGLSTGSTPPAAVPIEMTTRSRAESDADVATMNLQNRALSGVTAAADGYLVVGNGIINGATAVRDGTVSAYEGAHEMITHDRAEANDRRHEQHRDAINRAVDHGTDSGRTPEQRDQANMNLITETQALIQERQEFLDRRQAAGIDVREERAALDGLNNRLTEMTTMTPEQRAAALNAPANDPAFAMVGPEGEQRPGTARDQLAGFAHQMNSNNHNAQNNVVNAGVASGARALETGIKTGALALTACIPGVGIVAATATHHILGGIDQASQANPTAAWSMGRATASVDANTGVSTPGHAQGGVIARGLADGGTWVAGQLGADVNQSHAFAGTTPGQLLAEGTLDALSFIPAINQIRGPAAAVTNGATNALNNTAANGAQSTYQAITNLTSNVARGQLMRQGRSQAAHLAGHGIDVALGTAPHEEAAPTVAIGGNSNSAPLVAALGGPGVQNPSLRPGEALAQSPAQSPELAPPPEPVVVAQSEPAPRASLRTDSTLVRPPRDDLPGSNHGETFRRDNDGIAAAPTAPSGRQFARIETNPISNVPSSVMEPPAPAVPPALAQAEIPPIPSPPTPPSFPVAGAAPAAGTPAAPTVTTTTTARIEPVPVTQTEEPPLADRPRVQSGRNNDFMGMIMAFVNTMLTQMGIQAPGQQQDQAHSTTPTAPAPAQNPPVVAQNNPAPAAPSAPAQTPVAPAATTAEPPLAVQPGIAPDAQRPLATLQDFAGHAGRGLATLADYAGSAIRPLAEVPSMVTTTLNTAINGVSSLMPSGSEPPVAAPAIAGALADTGKALATNMASHVSTAMDAVASNGPAPASGAMSLLNTVTGAGQHVSNAMSLLNTTTENLSNGITSLAQGASNLTSAVQTGVGTLGGDTLGMIARAMSNNPDALQALQATAQQFQRAGVQLSSGTLLAGSDQSPSTGPSVANGQSTSAGVA